ncbi:unnamed protein product [Symbiodinium natans]|uniref:Uncharacterized protein n=1 Tax=Symbiodinium natans TaxID=878477 RepID=A0A812MHI2_9DINO|nr:unnamed protein product [Symbiodinium natans]
MAATPWEEQGDSNEDDTESRVSEQLSTKLHPSLLRGVPLHATLAGWGQHWANPDNGMFTIEKQPSYELSRPVESLDAFLSHDWASSRILKLLSLLIVYNSRAAFLSTLVVSILLGLLRGYWQNLATAGWTVAFGHGTFVFVFLFWQWLQRPFQRPRMVFLDKLCVAQHDAEKKKQGIMAMAAFLLSSKKLVVLLTPRYCQRLWCAFELATFMKEPKRLRAGIWLAFLMLCLASTVLPLVFYLGIGMVADMDDVLRQLADFKMQDAECFCCSHGHRHPTTSAQLPCDKRLVHKMLKEWYGEQGEHGDGAIDCSDCMYLERFNHVIREDLAPQVASLVGGFALPSNYTLYMVAVSAIPYLADHIAVFVVSLRAGTPSGYALFTWTLREASRWGVVAVASMLSVRLSLPLWKVCLRFCQNGSKWRLEDLREELAKLRDVDQKEISSTGLQDYERGAAFTSDLMLKGASENLSEEIAVQKAAIQEWKERVAVLEQQNAGLQVAVASAEHLLHRGRERLDAAKEPPGPWISAGSGGFRAEDSGL